MRSFSHATVPVFNLFKNCGYYWAYAAYISYFINHPLYTPPPLAQTYVALGLAMVCQWGNYRYSRCCPALRYASLYQRSPCVSSLLLLCACHSALTAAQRCCQVQIAELQLPHIVHTAFLFILAHSAGAM